MEPIEKTTEQEFMTILDNFLSDDKSTQDENRYIESFCWDDEWDNCGGDVILFI
jgi:hypothetical protein